MPATQHDIARLAGVSQAVVSDVLGSRARGRVNPLTRQRIIDAARQLNYQPHAAARALRERCSRQVSYFVSHPDRGRLDILSEEVVGAAAARLAEAGWRLTIEPSVAAPGDVEPLADRFAARASDGAILRALNWRSEESGRLASLTHPVVVVGQCEHPDVVSVAHDAAGIVRQAVAELRRRGHRRISLLSTWEGGDYFEQVRAAWQQAGGAPGDISTARTAADGVAALASWEGTSGAPTGIVCYSPEAALALHRDAASRGKMLGRDFDLVVVGAAQHAWALPAGTLFLGTDLRAIGLLAADALLALLQGSPTERRIRLKPDLRVVQ